MPPSFAERLADEIATSGKRVEVIDPAKDGGIYGAISKGIQLARIMAYEASKLRRVEVGDDRLCVGVKCGYSDTTSGIAGNPAVGYFFDKNILRKKPCFVLEGCISFIIIAVIKNCSVSVRNAFGSISVPYKRSKQVYCCKRFECKRRL